YNGEHDKVKEYAEKSIEIDNEYGFPYSLLGRYYHMLKNDNEQALKYYLIAEKYDCDVVIMYRAVSELYLEAGDFINAVKYASKAVKLDSKDGYSYYWKGYVYYRNQDFKSALKYFEQAENFGENFNSLFYEMSYCYSMLDKKEKGIEYANKYIFLDKKDFWGYYRKAFAYYQSGDDNNALEPFLMAEKLGCKELDMYSRLGFIYSIKKNNKQALKWIRKGYKLAGGDVDNEYYNSYVSILATAKQYKKALELVDIALEKFPEDCRLLIGKTSLLQCKKRYKEAEEVTKRLLEIDSENPYSILYEALMFANRPKKERDYDKIIALVKKIENVEIDDFGGRKG
ncbi:MAG: tetratricopeptide repeat protein, partial [Candidatus Gastranaerophilales bacterium]|nr:tetratricopeptide repeat protein [Candidatus Gastranaerophilales bacterium]